MESHNIALQGTLCTNGIGVGVCVGLGDKTVFGRIARQASVDRPVRTTLESEIFRFVIIIASLALFVALVIVGMQLYSWFVTKNSHTRSSMGRLASPRPSWIHYGIHIVN
jgi:magnesium-transporting ATPase (P-type)